MNDEEALAWLYGRQALGIKLGLDKVRTLLAALGNPQERCRIVHVAGTNGKGSVTTMLADVLHRAGFKVGATTSPHLVDFTERIRINGEQVAPADVTRWIAAMQPIVAALDAAGEPPTFFELVTAMAYTAFAEAGVDWAVVETGMGGRLDATNVPTPALTIITNVGMDHAGFLGDSVAQIATEKAGIMKPGVPCVTAASGPALHVLNERSHMLQVPMSVVGQDYVAVPSINGFRLAHPGGEAQYALAMAGAHQIENAALVVAATDALRASGVPIAPHALQEALATARMAGRMDLRTIAGPNGNVEVLLDGAHNVDGAVALRYHLGQMAWSGFDLIVGFQGDKEWPEMVQQWAPLAAHGWGVPLRSPRTLAPEQMRVAFDIIPFEACQDAGHALQSALARGATRIVVAGSLWLVGDAIAHIEGRTGALHGSQ